MKQVLFPRQSGGPADRCREGGAPRTRPLAFYLAAEEYLARNFREDFLMVWRVGPTVIFGRNQDMEAEVNVRYCREAGVQMFRRRSGGGCVYADEGNIMVSSITGGYDKAFIFSRFISSLALFLRTRGFDARPSGRNDICIQGRKVSGSAFYSAGWRNVIHATLLCNSDIGRMQMAITPSEEKLGAKGIASVRQRVANLSEFGKADTEALEEGLVRFFCDGNMELGEEDVERINAIMEGYLDDGFIHKGRRHRAERKKDNDDLIYGSIEKDLSV